MKPTIVVFGESEKGLYDTAYVCNSVSDLYEHLGDGKSGISLAIQALMYNYSVIFFKVEEEGYSIDSYFFGLHFLNSQAAINYIVALALPGVGDRYVIEASYSLCRKYHCILLFRNHDLYDLLTYTVAQ